MPKLTITPSSLTKNNAIEAFAFLALIPLTGFAFSFGLDGIFLLDDFHNIGPAFIDSFNFSELIQVMANNTSGIFGRPVSVLSFALTGLAHGDWVWGFKYHNILIHLLIGISIYCLSRRLLTVLSNSNLVGPTALLTSTIWLLHPLQVSTVMYAVQRMTQLSALFSVLAILVFLKGIQSNANRTKIINYFILFPTTLVLSLLSKENGVLIPVFIAVVTFAILYSSTDASVAIKNRLRSNRCDKLFLIAFVLLPITLGALGFAIKFESLLDYSSRPFDVFQRLLSQIDFVFLYIKQLLLPQLSLMGLFFDDVPIPDGMTFIRACKLAVISGLLVVGIVATVKGKSILGLGILFYFGGHLLESTIIPLELAFEHRNYLPSLGILMAISYYAVGFSYKKKVILVLTAMWLVMITSLLLLRLDYWSEESKWFQTVLAYHPKSERTQLNYIIALTKAGEHELVKEKLYEVRQALPQHLSFHIKQLITDCDNTNPEENTKARETIYNLVLTKPLTTIGFNHLGELVNNVLTTPCTSVFGTDAYIYLGAAMERLAIANKNSARYGHLNVLKAKLELALGNHKEAYSLYMKGFELTGVNYYSIWAVKALLVNPKTREDGLKKLKEIEAGKYFNPRLQQKRIDNVRQKIKDNDFNFRL